MHAFVVKCHRMILSKRQTWFFRKSVLFPFVQMPSSDCSLTKKVTKRCNPPPSKKKGQLKVE